MAEKHIHRWRIAEPEGLYSEGVCGGCGERRTFGNSQESGELLKMREKGEKGRAARWGTEEQQRRRALRGEKKVSA